MVKPTFSQVADSSLVPVLIPPNTRGRSQNRQPTTPRLAAALTDAVEGEDPLATPELMTQPTEQHIPRLLTPPEDRAGIGAIFSEGEIDGRLGPSITRRNVGMWHSLMRAVADFVEDGLAAVGPIPRHRRVVMRGAKSSLLAAKVSHLLFVRWREYANNKACVSRYGRLRVWKRRHSSRASLSALRYWILCLMDGRPRPFWVVFILY
jgi:hypothetical protein